MATIGVQDVAEFIVGHLRYHGEDISNLKQQKLLYYCQAWHLAFYDEPLFDARIKAWVHGPVIPEVYHYYRDTLGAKDWSDLPNPTDGPNLLKGAVRHVLSVLDTYGDLGACHLTRLTHQEMPWIAARGDIPPNQPSDAEISLDHMRDYYREMARENGDQEG